MWPEAQSAPDRPGPCISDWYVHGLGLLLVSVALWQSAEDSRIFAAFGIIGALICLVHAVSDDPCGLHRAWSSICSRMPCFGPAEGRTALHNGR